MTMDDTHPVCCYVLGCIGIISVVTNIFLLMQIKSHRSRSRSAVSVIISFVALADVATVLTGIPFTIMGIVESLGVSAAQTSNVTVQNVIEETNQLRGHFPSCLIVLFRTASALFQTCHVTYLAIRTRWHSQALKILNWTTIIVFVPGILSLACFTCLMPFIGIGEYGTLANLLVEDTSDVIGDFTVFFTILTIDGQVVSIACVYYIINLVHKIVHTQCDNSRETKTEVSRQVSVISRHISRHSRKVSKHVRESTQYFKINRSFSCPDLLRIQDSKSSTDSFEPPSPPNKSSAVSTSTSREIRTTKQLKRSHTIASKMKVTYIRNKRKQPEISIPGPPHRTRKLGVSSIGFKHPSSLKRRKYINQPLGDTCLNATSLTSFETDSSVFEMSPQKQLSTRKESPLPQAPETSLRVAIPRRQKSQSVTGNRTIGENKSTSLWPLQRHQTIKCIIATFIYCIVFSLCTLPHCTAIVLEQVQAHSLGNDSVLTEHVFSVILVYSSTIATVFYNIGLRNIFMYWNTTFRSSAF